MNYKDLLKKKFSEPVHAVHGPKTESDQLKALLWTISQSLESGTGTAHFSDEDKILVVMNPDNGEPISIPLSDLQMLGYIPLEGQSAEDFIIENFQDW